MIERHYFRDELVKSFDFTFGYVLCLFSRSLSCHIPHAGLLSLTVRTRGMLCTHCRLWTTASVRISFLQQTLFNT
jgi:hypothetical protein